MADTAFMASLGATPEQAEVTLTEALQHAVARGSLLAARLQIADVQETLYFFNTAKGRAAVKAIEKGAWRQANTPNQPIELLPEPPNIFQLYEANIGSLTPLLADALKDAEETYPASWIEEAFRIAAENNKRSWRYIAAILERWKREGFHERRTTQKNRPGSEKDSRRYIEGEFADDIEH